MNEQLNELEDRIREFWGRGKMPGGKGAEISESGLRNVHFRIVELKKKLV